MEEKSWVSSLKSPVRAFGLALLLGVLANVAYGIYYAFALVQYIHPTDTGGYVVVGDPSPLIRQRILFTSSISMIIYAVQILAGILLVRRAADNAVWLSGALLSGHGILATAFIADSLMRLEELVKENLDMLINRTQTPPPAHYCTMIVFQVVAYFVLGFALFRVAGRYPELDKLKGPAAFAMVSAIIAFVLPGLGMLLYSIAVLLAASRLEYRELGEMIP